MEKSVSIKHNKTYTCIYCEHSWSRNRDFERHLNTVKHEKKRQEVEKKRQMELQENVIHAADHPKINTSSPEKTMKTLFCCESCKFTTGDKKESLLHLKSGEHIKTSTVSGITIKYACGKCDKYYDNY